MREIRFDRRINRENIEIFWDNENLRLKNLFGVAPYDNTEEGTQSTKKFI